MKRIIIIIMCLVLCCCEQSSKNIFTDARLNSLFESFKQNAPYRDIFQIILGSNSEGIKVDFIALNLFLDTPLYVQEPTKLVFLGFYNDGKSMVSVYSCDEDRYCPLINMSALSITNIPSQKNEGCTIRYKIEGYQVYSDGSFEYIPKEKESVPKYYHLSEEGVEDLSVKLILFRTPHIYEILTSDAVLVGRWRLEKTDELVFTPKRLYRYSIVKNEMINFPVDSIPVIMNRKTADIFSTMYYKKVDDCLTQSEHIEDIMNYIWVPDVGVCCRPVRVP